MGTTFLLADGGEPPFLFLLQKIGHGHRLQLE
jgi:hypothetical protein